MSDKAPVITEGTGEPGRPSISDDQFNIWLESMRPFLQSGNSLNWAIDKAGLEQHKVSIYNKYRENDWFMKKIDALRATLGELVNEAYYTLSQNITSKIKRGESITAEEERILKHVSEKHRTAQPFFVTRVETAESDPDKIGKILDVIESDYEDLGKHARIAINEENTTKGSPE